jgi:hypothetical protein
MFRQRCHLRLCLVRPPLHPCRRPRLAQSPGYLRCTVKFADVQHVFVGCQDRLVGPNREADFPTCDRRTGSTSAQKRAASARYADAGLVGINRAQSTQSSSSVASIVPSPAKPPLAPTTKVISSIPLPPHFLVDDKFWLERMRHGEDILNGCCEFHACGPSRKHGILSHICQQLALILQLLSLAQKAWRSW